MNILGIEFAPLNIPLQRRLQTLAAASWLVLMVFGALIGPCFSLYLFFTQFWWLNLLYLCWMYLDRHTCDTGGRSSTWVQNWTWWYYLKGYFPARVLCVPNLALDPKRNYLFCCFPHGIMPIGPFINLFSHASEFRGMFPDFILRAAVLRLNFFAPYFREYALAMGGISCLAKSISHVLSKPEGKHLVILWPGGASEAFNSRPGRYRFILKKRKGFVKLALQNGTPLVPVISFGECDLYEQIEGPCLRKVQEFLRKHLTFAPVVVNGRGFFQYSFGIIPRRKPVTTVVGMPVPVAKVENPTTEQIEELHQTFVQALQNLFEEYKYKFVENPAETHLEVQ